LAILIEERVVAVHSMANGRAYIYGAGVVTAEEEPMRGWLRGTGITAMRIELDNGGVLWSNECHAIPEKNWNASRFTDVVILDAADLDKEPLNAG